MNENLRKAKAIEKKNKAMLLKIRPDLKDKSGIYFLTRHDENGIPYFYIGQSVKVLSRLAQHLVNYQHIDLSIKKRGFYSEENPYGWKVGALYYPVEQLDEMEKHWIHQYTALGYQCRYNKTAGGQGKGKEKINEFRPSRGYRDGVLQGKKTLANELSHIIEKHLEIGLKEGKENNKVSQKALEKFNQLISEETYNGKGAE